MLPEGEEIVVGTEISLKTHGNATKHKGKLTVSIPVDEKYNGMKMKILHDKGDSVEILYGKVKEGLLVFETESLSPFAVVASEGSPNTGDYGMHIWVMLLLLSALSVAAIKMKIKKSIIKKRV